MRIVLWVILALALIALLCVGGLLFQRQSSQNQLDQVISALSLPQGEELIRTYRCWDIFSHCGNFAYFATNLTLEEVHTLVGGLGMEGVNHGEISGYEIFTEINQGTASRLALDGVSDPLELASFPHFNGYSWQLRDAQEQLWFIKFFPLRQAPGPVTLDQKPFTGNLMMILQQTR